MMMLMIKTHFTHSTDIYISHDGDTSSAFYFSTKLIETCQKSNIKCFKGIPFPKKKLSRRV